MDTFIRNALIISPERDFVGHLLISDDRIARVYSADVHAPMTAGANEIDASGELLMPGVIDSHVHFREPGMTEKADIASESRAAVAGGVTSFFDMPNCVPPTTSIETLEEKRRIAARGSSANYSFYIGATNDNLPALRAADPASTPGIKLFLGASTGGMFVDSPDALEGIFQLGRIVSVHSEDGAIIAANAEAERKGANGGEVPIGRHPYIRSREACISMTAKAISLAERNSARVHVLHLSTADELKMVKDSRNSTSEVCVSYLLFDDRDYQRLGAAMKCNPAIKGASDREALLRGIADGSVDVVSTDHAPHLWKSKLGDALTAASGMPSIQYSLVAMLDLADKGHFSPHRVADVMAHNQSRLFGIEGRGSICEGNYADLTVVAPSPTIVSKSSILSRCGWSPFEGRTFSRAVRHTFVNGRAAYFDGVPTGSINGRPLRFKK